MEERKQVMDMRSTTSGISQMESNEQQRNWSDEQWKNKAKDKLIEEGELPSRTIEDLLDECNIAGTKARYRSLYEYKLDLIREVTHLLQKKYKLEREIAQKEARINEFESRFKDL